MFFFKKRRKKDAALENDFEEIRDHLSLNEDGVEQPEKVEHYAIDCCEQMIETSKELEDQKAEYRVVTSYLNDIELLEGLPENEKKELADVAQNVVQLNQARDEFLNTSKKISDSQFAQMQQEEDEIPKAIKRLQSNEAYQMTIKRDMTYLDGKKHQWTYHKEEMKRQKKFLRNAAYALTGTFLIIAIILITIQLGFEGDVGLAWTILVFAVAGAGAYISWKIQDCVFEIRQAEVNINGAITLLNKVKIKYVNITNAVDYSCEKYHVKNSHELNYIWEQYMEAVKEKEKYAKTNEDLEYFNGKLVRMLKKYQLYDAKVWIYQAQALMDKKEMVEVKHNLLVRRQKLRDRIEYNMENLKAQKLQVEKMMGKMGDHAGKIQQIIDAIERISEA